MSYYEHVIITPARHFYDPGRGNGQPTYRQNLKALAAKSLKQNIGAYVTLLTASIRTAKRIIRLLQIDGTGRRYS